MKRFKKTNIEISHDTMCIKFLRFLIFNDLEKINILKKSYLCQQWYSIEDTEPGKILP